MARPLLFWLAMLLIPVAFFGALEGGLRLTGFGGDYPLFAPVPEHGDYLHPNPETGRRYFARTSVVPAPMHDAFAAEKSPQTVRLFVQGASTAAGFPYGRSGSFSRMLEQRLAATLPGRDVEVVNTSMAAVNSYTLRDQAEEILAQHPDAVLIYAGHNEYYGALGAASTESIGAAARLYLAVDHLRTVQAARRLWTGISGGRAADAPGATLMHEMAQKRSIPFESAAYRRGLRQFESNLRPLLCRYRDAGVPTFIGTLAANERDQPPFVSGLSEGTDTAAWHRDFRAVEWVPARRRDSTDTGQNLNAAESALSTIDSLLGIDDRSADAYFARARLHDAAGRHEKARRDYVAAKDRDELRFRAPEAINDVIRDAAETCGATVVDTRGTLAGASPDGIIGEELMLEHLHPNVDGQFLLADAFYEALGDAGFFEASARRVPAEIARRDLLVTELDSTLASLHVRRLLNNWPFQPHGVTRRDTIAVADAVDELALDVLRGRRTWVDAAAALGAHYESRGRLDDALRIARALIQEQPYTEQPYLLAGNILVKQGRFGAAFPFFHAADARGPSSEARRMAGHTLVRAGRATDAIPWLHGALELEPDHREALYDLAVAFAESGRRGEALSAAGRLLRLDPADPGARRLVARLE